MRVVGEKAARDGLSLELEGLFCPELAVEMGVRPRRDVGLLLHAELCALVLFAPDALVGLFDDSGGSEEGGGRLLMGTAARAWG